MPLIIPAVESAPPALYLGSSHCARPHSAQVVIPAHRPCHSSLSLHCISDSSRCARPLNTPPRSRSHPPAMSLIPFAPFTNLGRGEQVTSCAGHRTRGHCALSAMLTVSQLSKSFASRALFDDVSLQVNRGEEKRRTAQKESPNHPTK